MKLRTIGEKDDRILKVKDRYLLISRLKAIKSFMKIFYCFII